MLNNENKIKINSILKEYKNFLSKFNKVKNEKIENPSINFPNKNMRIVFSEFTLTLKENLKESVSQEEKNFYKKVINSMEILGVNRQFGIESLYFFFVSEVIEGKEHFLERIKQNYIKNDFLTIPPYENLDNTIMYNFKTGKFFSNSFIYSLKSDLKEPERFNDVLIREIENSYIDIYEFKKINKAKFFLKKIFNENKNFFYLKLKSKTLILDNEKQRVLNLDNFNFLNEKERKNALGILDLLKEKDFKKDFKGEKDFYIAFKEIGTGIHLKVITGNMSKEYLFIKKINLNKEVEERLVKNIEWILGKIKIGKEDFLLFNRTINHEQINTLLNLKTFKEEKIEFDFKINTDSTLNNNNEIYFKKENILKKIKVNCILKTEIKIKKIKDFKISKHLYQNELGDFFYYIFLDDELFIVKNDFQLIRTKNLTELYKVLSKNKELLLKENSKANFLLSI